MHCLAPFVIMPQIVAVVFGGMFIAVSVFAALFLWFIDDYFVESR